LFISYRREDSAGFAGRLQASLERRFGAEAVFRDVADLRPGEDFPAALRAGIEHAVAILVVIGPRWLSVEREGHRRLDQPQDQVRREVQMALSSNKPVIPVLVGGAQMPEAQALPPSLRALARLHAVELGDAGWDEDFNRLAGSLAPLLAAQSGSQRRRRLLQGGFAVAVLAVGGGLWLGRRAADIAGRWEAAVVYDWGDRYREVFSFERFAGKWQGTAGFVGRARPVQGLELDGRRLSFETRSTEVHNNDREVALVHQYVGEVEDARIRFQMTTRADGVARSTIRFEAQRVH
jgi:hypothetical protein